LLTADSGAWVILRYVRTIRKYSVNWEDGPTVQQMQIFAARHVEEVSELDIGTLVWRRANGP
jgi:hypothetical protein